MEGRGGRKEGVRDGGMKGSGGGESEGWRGAGEERVRDGGERVRRE